MDKSIYIEESGCNRRKLDVAKFKKFFLANGYQLVSNPKSASYIIVTTCAFKKSEEESSITRVRHYVNSYPGKVVVYGCLPSIAPQKYREFEHIKNFAPREIEKIDTIFDDIDCSFSEILDEHVLNSEKDWMNGVKRKVVTGEVFSKDFVKQAQNMVQQRFKEAINGEDSHYYLFICRGCLGKCSYCAIRRSVGHVQSKSRQEVVREFVQGLEAGQRSFVLLGDDPGCYGLDLGTNLPELMLDLVAVKNRFQKEEKAVVRFSLNEIHPKFLIHYRSEMVEILSDTSFTNILCPLQSGSDRILNAMEREHRTASLRSALEEIRGNNPEMVFDTQIMVGFPTESEEEFDATLQYVAETGFNSVVVFPYDDKEGTAAQGMFPKIPSETIKQRTRKAFKFFRGEDIQAYYNCP